MNSNQSGKCMKVEERGEWTPLLHQVGLDVRVYAHDETSGWKYLVRLCDSEQSARLHTPRFVEAVNKEVERRIDAALKAEREKREEAERWLEEKRDESAMFADDASKYYDKLLAALAAIERMRIGLPANIDHLSALREHDAELRATIAKVEHENIVGNLSPEALAKHDAEMTIKIRAEEEQRRAKIHEGLTNWIANLESSRKPLVDALTKLRAECAPPTDKRELVEWTGLIFSSAVKEICDAALASVKI